MKEIGAGVAHIPGVPLRSANVTPYENWSKMGNPANWDYELVQVNRNEHTPGLKKQFSVNKRF